MDERAIRFELERQACQSLRQVLQLKLQQRRSREELVNQGIMPPLKSSAGFHEQRRCLERARTEDYLKRKIRSRPERSELIRMHILEETSAEPSLQAKQLQLKRSRLTDGLNDKISHRPGPMELIHKNILPVHSSIKQAIMETQFPKASADNSSCDEDSYDSLSPEQPVNQESPLSLGPMPSPPETLAGSSIPSPSQVPPPATPVPSISGSSPSLKLTNGVAAPSAQRTGVTSQIKSQSKLNCDRSAQRHKKPKDNKPKIKKLKYHQYIPPDQKGDKEPPPHLDSSYAKILQQQQLFLQLQILSQQQQQQHNYPTILPAPPKPQTDQQPPSTSSSNAMTTSSPPWPVATPSTAPSNQDSLSHQSSTSSRGTKPVCLPPNLDEMKVAELKSELKLRSLPVSGTKNDLIERLKTYQELNGGSDTTSSPTLGGTIVPGAEGVGKSPKTVATTISSSQQQQQFQFQCHQTSSLISHSASAGRSATPAAVTAQHLMNCAGNVSPPAVPLTPSDHSLVSMSPEETCFNSNPLEMLGLQPSSTPQLSTTIKEEPSCSTATPCQFSLKAVSLQKHCLVSSAAPTTTTTASAATMDKDKMLQQKDKQIEELTKLLMQKQRLVEILRMQLEHGKRGGQVAEPVVLVRVKQEPPDKPDLTIPSSSLSYEMDVTKVTVKQEAIDAEEVESETTMRSPGMAHGLLHSQTQEQIQLQIKPGQTSIQTKQHQIKQQQQTKQPQQIQIQTKIHLKQQQLLIQQKQKGQKQSLQLSQAHLNQQSGSTPSFTLDLLKSDSTPTLVTDGNGNHFLIALTSHITDDQRTDAPESKETNHITLQRLQSTPAKLPSQDPVQSLTADNQSKQNMQLGFSKQQNSKAHSGGLQVSVDQPQQGVTQCLSAPPSLKPFFKDLETTSLGENTTLPSSPTEVCPNMDVLFSPLSPASIKTVASSPDNKDKEHEDDFIDIILKDRTGEMSTTFKLEPDPSLDHLNSTSSASSSLDHFNSTSSASSPPPPPVLAGCDNPQFTPSTPPELQTPADNSEEKQHFSNCTSGRLEDFLESTTGTPLLGVEPGGLLTLIDDLHSQMLCTPSILNHPPSPMDTFNLTPEGEQALDSMDWLGLSMGEEKGEETPTLAPLGPPTPTSVFSTDFLDTYDLQMHWDSCL
ncbi:myocardin-related transcription factor A-like [Scomber japonicus]|uniref:myocardin-related transcription factor A-like n=1 Tax=Scomber japonicus TaxID=13676 RepID=UPI0023061F11|nr:myocardin-related transcription factor A-like [Scomber japonicus]